MNSMDSVFGETPTLQDVIVRHKKEQVLICPYDPKLQITTNISLSDLIDAGYSRFQATRDVLPPTLNGEGEGLDHYVFIYKSPDEGVLGTLSLMYSKGVKTGIDRFFEPMDPNSNVQDLVKQTTNLLPPFVTIGRLTIAKNLTGNPANLKVKQDGSAFMHLSNAAAHHVESSLGHPSSGVMIARPGLIKILNQQNLRFLPVQGLKGVNDPELNVYKEFYSRYWLLRGGPSVYATSSSDIINATEEYVNGGNMTRKRIMAKTMFRMIFS